MNRLAWSGDGDRRIASTPGCRWLQHVTTWRPHGAVPYRHGDGETLALLLAGTFDLAADGTAWPARGARRDPFGGRPMAVFLPPGAAFTATNGSGEILLVAAHQPELGAAPTGLQALAQKPLLPLAGSGKAFDPTAGTWRPAETFPTSPESLPPRRMQQLTCGATRLERVFARDYKAMTLSLDEAVIPAGATLDTAAIADAPRGDELLLFVRSEGRATVGDHEVLAGTDAAFVATPAEAVRITAAAGRCYAVLACAGK